MDNTPAEQTTPYGLDVEGQVRDALTTLANQPERDSTTGQFVRGTQAAGHTLARSSAFWEAVADAKHALLDQVHRDLAIDASTPTTMRGLADAYAEARLFRSAMFLRLTEMGGPVTTKGRARSLYKAYLAAIDRELRLAQTLGLDRRSKWVGSVGGPVDTITRIERVIVRPKADA